MWGETEGLILLYWSVLFVGGRLVRQEIWEGSEVGRWEGSEVGRWERWENEAERSEVPGFIKGGGHKICLRFHLLVSDVNQGNKGVGWVQDFLAWPQG